jgi:NAD(P)-dependent dehydrogenase (short-subunit alcohol dehydrogenase family)
VQQFVGRVAIVTGGGSGIGRAAALDFAAAGACVAVAGRTMASLGQTAALAARSGAAILAVPTDVTRSDEVRALVAATLKAFGRLDFLVNNAGISADGKPICDADEDLFDQIYATNVRGPFLCMKYAIPEMLRVGGGCIVNVSSNQGLVGGRGVAGYAASKHALNGLTKVAAAEYAAMGIRVNAVCPAGTDTDMLRKLSGGMAPEAWNARIGALYPAGKVGTAEQVSAVIRFLCSDAASHIHGTAIPVDGGFTAL